MEHIWGIYPLKQSYQITGLCSNIFKIKNDQIKANELLSATVSRTDMSQYEILTIVTISADYLKIISNSPKRVNQVHRIQ